MIVQVHDHLNADACERRGMPGRHVFVESAEKLGVILNVKHDS